MMTENSILPKDCDPMGQAILDYQTTGKASTLKVLSTMFDDDEMSVPYLFRTEESFPVLERVALGMASGRVLEKCGFETFFTGEGAYHDGVYEICKSVWKA